MKLYFNKVQFDVVLDHATKSVSMHTHLLTEKSLTTKDWSYVYQKDDVKRTTIGVFQHQTGMFYFTPEDAEGHASLGLKGLMSGLYELLLPFAARDGSVSKSLSRRA